MLTENGILTRRTRYACCAMRYLVQSIEAEIVGETRCAAELYERAVWMYLASIIMKDTPIGDEEGCTSLLYASDIADIADCFCSICSCPTPAPLDCAIVHGYTVISALPFASLPVSPAPTSAYYILSGTNEGMIGTWNGAVYAYTPVVDSVIVLASSTGIYYINYGAGPGPLFPDGVLTNISAGVYELTTASPQTALNRIVQLQGFLPNVGWVNIALPTTESSIIPPAALTINLLNVPFSDTRLHYTIVTPNGNCEYNSGTGSIVPPGCFYPRDHDCFDHDTLDHS